MEANPEFSQHSSDSESAVSEFSQKAWHLLAEYINAYVALKRHFQVKPDEAKALSDLNLFG
jgi:hypothetical protein